MAKAMQYKAGKVAKEFESESEWYYEREREEKCWSLSRTRTTGEPDSEEERAA